MSREGSKLWEGVRRGCCGQGEQVGGWQVMEGRWVVFCKWVGRCEIGKSQDGAGRWCAGEWCATGGEGGKSWEGWAGGTRCRQVGGESRGALTESFWSSQMSPKLFGTSGTGMVQIWDVPAKPNSA